MIDKTVAATRIWYGTGLTADVSPTITTNQLKNLIKINVQVIMLRYVDNTYRTMHGTNYYWRVSANDWHQGDQLSQVPSGATRFDGLAIDSLLYLGMLKSAFMWTGATADRVSDLRA